MAANRNSSAAGRSHTCKVMGRGGAQGGVEATGRQPALLNTAGWTSVCLSGYREARGKLTLGKHPQSFDEFVILQIDCFVN